MFASVFGGLNKSRGVIVFASRRVGTSSGMSECVETQSSDGSVADGVHSDGAVVTMRLG